MSTHRRRPMARTTRPVWMGVALLLLVLLGGSFLMLGRATESAEADAQERAERYASILSNHVTSEMASDDILQNDYRDLLIQVQAGIKSDDRVAEVRIWKPDGDLIFSTNQRDKIEESAAPEEPDPQVAAAADGETVSLVIEATVAPRADLEGSDEKLLETFIPLRLGSGEPPAGVVQIDQRYAAIEEEANRVWRPVQIGLIVALGVVAVAFGLSLRAGPGIEPATATAPASGNTREARKLRDAEERALAAERAAREVERRLAESERRMKEASKVEAPPNVLARVEELETKLRAEEGERERVAAEAHRLRSALSEKEAELALARENRVSDDAETAMSRGIIAKAEERATAAEQRAQEAVGSIADANRRIAELENALLAADRKALEAAEASARTKHTEETKLGGDLRKSQLETNELKMRLTEAESLLKEATLKLAEREDTSAELERLRSEVEMVRTTAKEEADRLKAEVKAGADRLKADADAAKAHAQGFKTEAERSRAELADLKQRLEKVTADGEKSRTEADMALSTAKADAEKLRAEAAAARAEADQTRAETDRTKDEFDRLRAELDRVEAEIGAMAADRDKAPTRGERDAAATITELEKRLEQMEAQRRDEVGELQHAQESLANTQVELMDVNRKLREAQDRIRELESEGAAPAARAEPAYVPSYAARSEAYEEPLELTSSFAARLSHLREEIASHAEALTTTEVVEEEPAEETLSLRERLARAAAARHRTGSL